MFVIQLKDGHFIYGLEATFQIVQWTKHRGDAAVFKTEAAAWRFINRYTDAGYGLTKDDCQVVPALMMEV